LSAFDRSGREALHHGGDVVEKEYPEAAVERAMKVQEVIMRAMAKRITWWDQAVERARVYFQDPVRDAAGWNRSRRRCPLSLTASPFFGG